MDGCRLLAAGAPHYYHECGAPSPDGAGGPPPGARTWWAPALLCGVALVAGIAHGGQQPGAWWSFRPNAQPAVPSVALPALSRLPFAALARVRADSDAEVAVDDSGGAPRLPTGAFKPKQSLGQNFLVDPSMIRRIVETFAAEADRPRGDPEDPSATYAGENGRRVLEVGPGIGALTDRLAPRYARMQAVEIDRRAIAQLQDRHTGLTVMHGNAIEVNYTAIAAIAGGPLCVVGNLPYYITSELLYSLLNGGLDGAVHVAGVTMQWEAAERLTSRPGQPIYGLLPISAALFSRPVIAFRISSGVFYPRPRVDSAFVLLRLKPPAEVAELLDGASLADLRQVLTAAFGQRRKKLRNSLLPLVTTRLANDDKAAAQALLDTSPGAGGALPVDWVNKRPEQLQPEQFIAIVLALFGRRGTVRRGPPGPDGSPGPVLGHGETFGRP